MHPGRDFSIVIKMKVEIMIKKEEWWSILFYEVQDSEKLTTLIRSKFFIKKELLKGEVELDLI